MMSATPTTASRFWANERRPSRQPLWMTVTSPPSATAGGAVTGRTSTSLNTAASWSLQPASTRLTQPARRVGYSQRDAGEVDANDGEHSAHERVNEDYPVLLA